MSDSADSSMDTSSNPRKSAPKSRTKPASAPSKAASTPAKRRKRVDIDDDDEDEDFDTGPSKKRAKPASTSLVTPMSSGTPSRRSARSSKPVSKTVYKQPPELLLAHKWDLETGTDPTGWWVSEKLDGVRALYDGTGMLSRLGNPFSPPQWFLDKLPQDINLDGELFVGRGKFAETISIVKTVNSPNWSDITFQIFDIPSSGSLPFEKRLSKLESLFGEKGTHKDPQIKVVQNEKVKNKEHVLERLKEVETLGGEGLMLRKSKSVYEGRRSHSLLKVKTFYDAEAKIIGYEPGSGRHTGQTGSLRCVMESGKVFTVGSGLTDELRARPPKKGTIITYRFQEITASGMPRFPSYVGEAIDKTGPKDAEIPEHRKPQSSKDDA